MKKLLSVFTVLLSAFMFVSPVLADTFEKASDTSVNVFGPLNQYEGIDSANWGSSVPAVATWVHPSWPSITGATWISSAVETETPRNNTWRLFSDTLNLPECAANITGNLIKVTSDNAEEVYLNGALIGSDGEVQTTPVDNQEWSTVLSYPLNGLTVGSNSLKTIVRNYASATDDPHANPTGLIYRVEATYSLSDRDGDGVCDGTDNCISSPNSNQADGDGDGVGDVCDNCVAKANTDQADSDLDEVGDVCDNCVNVSNIDQADIDKDGIGDVCDRDNDNDGVENEIDFCGSTSLPTLDSSLQFTAQWGVHRWHYDGLNWIQQPNPKGKLSGQTFNIQDTYGCSCYDILEKLKSAGLGQFGGHYKYGCSSSILSDFHLDLSDGVLDGSYLIDTVTVNSKLIGGVNSVVNLVSDMNYRFDVTGTWTNRAGETVDAKYTTMNNWGSYVDAPAGGFPNELLDLQINNGFVDWGTYSAAHKYSRAFAGNGSTVNFRVFDGDVATNTPNPGWYGDNNGSLTVNIYAEL